MNSLPHEHRAYWAREAHICYEDGYPGAAVYAYREHLRRNPGDASPYLVERMADLMAEQLGYRPESIDG